MNIFIAGSGRVGYHIARLLSLENHNVTVLESDRERVQQADYALDASTLQGNAASVLFLQQAGVGEGDLFVAVTGNDELNLVAAATAKGLGAKEVVARVDNPTYFESNILYETVLGIDFIISAEALAANQIARYIESRGMVLSENFAHGLVAVRQLRVRGMKEPRRLERIEMPEGVLVGLVSRNGSLFIPRGDTELRDGDLVTFIGLPQQMPVLRKQFQGQEPKLDDVVIMGGGTVGLHLARILETRKPSVKLLDWDPNRCEYLSSELSKTEVICRDASSRTSLEEERVDQTDVFVATTNDDERNIMAGVLAKEVGAARCVAVVHQPDFAPLVAKLGIDHAVTPRACVANRVLRIVRRDSASSVTVIEEGHVEVLEFTVTGNSPILGKSLKDARIPRDALVANILRGDKVIVPHGDDEFHAGDSAVVLAKMNALEAVRKLFAR